MSQFIVQQTSLFCIYLIIRMHERELPRNVSERKQQHHQRQKQHCLERICLDLSQQ